MGNEYMFWWGGWVAPPTQDDEWEEERVGL